MNTTRVLSQEEQIVFAPPQYRDLGTTAWRLATVFFYTFAVMCTVFWIIYLLSFGFTVNLAFPLLFWNIAPWMTTLYTRKRMREARQRTALARERRAALADAVTQVAQDALARKATAAGTATKTATNPPPARRAHWWTDTPLREENKQRLGRGGSDRGG